MALEDIIEIEITNYLIIILKKHMIQLHLKAGVVLIFLIKKYQKPYF